MDNLINNDNSNGLNNNSNGAMHLDAPPSIVTKGSARSSVTGGGALRASTSKASRSMLLVATEDAADKAAAASRSSPNNNNEAEAEDKANTVHSKVSSDASREQDQVEEGGKDELTEEEEQQKADAIRNIPTKTNLDYVPGYFQIDNYKLCRIGTAATQEGDPLANNITTGTLMLPMPHQCAGSTYNRFAKALEYQIRDELNHRTQHPRWGKRTLLLPFVTAPSYNRRQRSILVVGNSHTEQLISTLLCQLRPQILDRAILYTEEEGIIKKEQRNDGDLATLTPNDLSKGYIMEFRFTQNTIVHLVVNALFLQSPRWISTLESTLGRPVAAYDAVVMGSLAPAANGERAYQSRISKLQQDHAEKQIRAPSVTDMANAYPGPILWAGMFDESAEDQHETTRKEIKLLKTHSNPLQNRTNVKAVDARRFIRQLKAELSSSTPTTADDECVASHPHEREATTDKDNDIVTTCVKDTSDPRYHEGHRCTGAMGGHPDLIAWDLLELLHEEVATNKLRDISQVKPGGGSSTVQRRVKYNPKQRPPIFPVGHQRKHDRKVRA